MTATLHMEAMGRSLVHAVIPLIDNVTTRLQKASRNAALNITIRAAALAGIKVLNKYYSRTDDTIIYCIAMSKLLHYEWFVCTNLLCYLVMHPKYKLVYFHQQNWELEWITTARGLALDFYNKHYRPTLPNTQDSSRTLICYCMDDVCASTNTFTGRRRKQRCQSLCSRDEHPG